MTTAIENRLQELLAEGVAARVFPAGAAWVGVRGGRIFEAYVGAERRVRWDVASLTKPMVVVDMCMRGVTAGALDLDRPIDPGLPAHVTPRVLLGHRAGLPAWKDLVAALPAELGAGRRATRLALEALVRQAARDADPARGVEYSDLGFMLLGRWLERRHQKRLSDMVRGFRSIPERRKTAAATSERFVSCGYCPWRTREVIGEVHDPNAWAWGGAAGHAGLFATAGRVGRWAMQLMEGRASGIDPGVTRAFWQKGDGGTWALGWDTPSAEGSSAGTTVEASAVGHLGFTGTSVWIEPVRGLVTVLLTNRVALGPESQAGMKVFRPRFHDEIRAFI